jgi:hypothetical protein
MTECHRSSFAPFSHARFPEQHFLALSQLLILGLSTLFKNSLLDGCKLVTVAQDRDWLPELGKSAPF